MLTMADQGDLAVLTLAQNQLAVVVGAAVLALHVHLPGPRGQCDAEPPRPIGRDRAFGLSGAHGNELEAGQREWGLVGLYDLAVELGVRDGHDFVQLYSGRLSRRKGTIGISWRDRPP